MEALNPENVCFLIVKARAFDVQEGVVELEYGANQADEDFQEILAAHADDATFDEIKSAIDAMNYDEQCELVALAWVGRGDFTVEDWDEALETARDSHTDITAEYLLGMPLLADFLQEGLAAFDINCDDVEAAHL